jgi:hypothetical protein
VTNNRLLLDCINTTTLGLSSSLPGQLLLGTGTVAEQLAQIQVSASLAATLQNLVDDDTITASADQGLTATVPSLSTGTGANQADRAWRDTTRTLTSGSSDDIDIYDLDTIDIGGGAGKSALGQDVALVELVGLLVENLSTSVGDLIIGNNATAAAFSELFNGSDTAELKYPPGGVHLSFCPGNPAWPIADTTNHLLRIAASGGNITYNIALLARSA